MVSVRKSPNMMSTTGRRPVIAAPTPIPVKPASEMGVSSTRSAPNSSTRPERTLNGVPASATSSPKMQTRESRRISSASASRTACANVSSRSGINVLVDLIGARIGSFDCKLHRCCHFAARFGGNAIECGRVSVVVRSHPACMQLDGIALGLPLLFFLLGSVILAIDVTDVMTAVAVGVGLQEGGTLALSRSLDQTRGDFVHCAYILTVNRGGFDAESSGAPENRSGGGLRVMCVLVIQIVFADVDHRQLPELGEVHHFVERSLAERAFAEEADRDFAITQSLGGERRAGGDSNAASNNRIRSQIAGRGIGNVH